MPIEVKELIIKTTIDKPIPYKIDPQSISPQKLKQLKQEMIEECLDKMTNILNRRLKR